MTRWKTMPEQVARMRELAPFMLEARTGLDWFASWSGPMRPLQKTYRISINFAARWMFGDLEIAYPYTTVVRLVEPVLQVCHPETGTRVPHIYGDASAPARSRLCFYDPVAGDWSRSDFIAETIVPWACDWLICYEGWLATGEWTGGGRHPGEPVKSWRTSPPLSAEPTPVPPEPVAPVGPDFLGRPIGNFASSPSTVVASAGYSPPRSLPDWRSSSSMALALGAVSI
jgi:hypothetical protein